MRQAGAPLPASCASTPRVSPSSAAHWRWPCWPARWAAGRLPCPLVALAAVLRVLLPRPRAPRAGRALRRRRAVARRRAKCSWPARRWPRPRRRGSWRQVSIFLSPMDVHVNRVPASGRVTRVVLTRGRFLPAYRREAATINERSEIWIDHKGQPIVARQIVGILARRVVCRLEEGARVARRRSARDHEVRVAHGRVRAGRRRDRREGRREGARGRNRHRGATLEMTVLNQPEGRVRFFRRAGDRPRARVRRGVYLLPSLMTMGNMFCGYACVVYAARGEFETAAPFIGFAIVLDMLDGRIARLTGTDQRVRRRVRLAGGHHLVRDRAGHPVVFVGAGLARPPRLGGGVSVRRGRRDAARAFQHPVGGRRRQALLRRDAEPGGGRDSGGDRLRVSVGPARLPGRAARAGDGAAAGAADGEHDSLSQLQDDRSARQAVVHDPDRHRGGDRR